jgi:hypothetical protein
VSQGRGRVEHGRERVRQDRGTTEARHERVGQGSACYGMQGLAKVFKDTYAGPHELQGFGLGRVGAKNRRWAGAKKQMPGWTEARCWAGQRPDAGLDRGQMLGWTEARCWAGQRPEVGLDRGQRLGWTEAPRLLVNFVTSFNSSIWAGGQDRTGSVRAWKGTEKEGNGTEIHGRAGQMEVTEQKVRGTENHGTGGHGRAQEGNEWQGTKVSSHGSLLGRDWTADIT